MLMISLGNKVKEWISGLGFSEEISFVMRDFTDFIILLLVITALYYIFRVIVIKIVRRITHRTSSTWDDALYHNRVFHKSLLLVPTLLFNVLAPYTLTEFPDFLKWALLLNRILIVYATIGTINKFLNALYEIYQGFEVSKAKPVKGYIQVLKIIVIVIGVIIVISLLFDKSPIYLLGGLGAFSAVLLLIFKDPILGLVAGIQISANDMVRQGDWIVAQKSGADGEVRDISLTTVKVQNWDKSITMLPTYSLVSESFVNWRGMEESGGRRIKRSINIDMNSVRFCTEEMLEKFRKIDILRNYIEQTQQELVKHNTAENIDDSILVNGRRQTNLGVFRAYLSAYLQRNPDLNPDMTMLVRQLQPGESGIPLEIYVFSRIQDWKPYEDIQSDIFDHVLASIPEFELKVFQNPSGSDFAKLGQQNKILS
ncbi:MAG TPA: mechanosensitive ion channel domain-containing protein [Lentimicrobium sp.]|nr:mechanosensitive ion channel domain-containing protein [Lentimicrobium sp.]